ncbi:MAG TPA: sigma factor [Acidimicrobiales bacterium]|nr:sigma factor [Acidimicrobiales bacterium]
MRRSQQGDRRAFGALVGRYDARLRGLAFALLLDPEAMDATLGSAYLRAWRDVVRLTAKDDAGAWLYRVTYNACIDALRRDGTPPQPGGRGTRAGLATLGPADRVAVVLVDREGFTPEAAARILGLSPADFDRRLDAARATLAGYLPTPAPAAGAAAGAAARSGVPQQQSESAETPERADGASEPPEPAPAGSNGSTSNGNGATPARQRRKRPGPQRPAHARSDTGPAPDPAPDDEAIPVADAPEPAGENP